MIDNILSLKSRANQELAQKLLEVHKVHFDQPQFPTTSRLETQAEKTAKQLASLVEDPAKRAKFIVELAYALRQKAADEIWGPRIDDYRGAVIADDEDEPVTPRKCVCNQPTLMLRLLLLYREFFKCRLRFEKKDPIESCQ